MLADGKRLKRLIARDDSDAQMIDTLRELVGGPGTAADRTTRGLSLGAQFVRSDLFRELQHTRGGRGKGWHSRSSHEPLLAAALAEAPASGGALALPQVIPEIIPSPTAPIVVSALFAPGTATSNAIVYMKEQTFTNAAAPTAEAATKPESALEFEAVTEPLRKIPHWLPVSEEILNDVPQMQSYIDARSQLGVLLVLDDQLLNGDGTGVNLKGMSIRIDLSPALSQGPTDTAIDAIARQIVAVQTASQKTVDGIVPNPSDWLMMQLAKTSNKEYLSGSPFDAAQPATLWGRTVAQTPKMPAGSALVDATNSHSDFFIKNLVAIRAKIRAQLAPLLADRVRRRDRSDGGGVTMIRRNGWRRDPGPCIICGAPHTTCKAASAAAADRAGPSDLTTTRESFSTTSRGVPRSSTTSGSREV